MDNDTPEGNEMCRIHMVALSTSLPCMSKPSTYIRHPSPPTNHASPSSIRLQGLEQLERLALLPLGLLALKPALGHRPVDGVGLVGGRVVRGIRRQHVPHNRGIALAVQALPGTDGRVVAAYSAQASRNVLAGNGALKDAQDGQRLVKGHLVAALVDAQEGKVGGLLDLTVRLVVGGLQVGVACAAEIWRVDLEGDCLAA